MINCIQFRFNFGFKFNLRHYGTAHATPQMRRGLSDVRSLCNACGMWYGRHGTVRPVVVVDVDGHLQDEVVDGTPPALYDNVDGGGVPEQQGGAPLPLPPPPPLLPPPPSPPRPPPERTGPAAAAAAGTVTLALGPLRPDTRCPICWVGRCRLNR